MLREELLAAVQAHYGQEACLLDEQHGNTIISYPIGNDEFDEQYFPSYAACFGHLLEKRKKLGIDLSVCDMDYSGYKTGIPDLDIALLRGFREGPMHRQKMKQKDGLRENIRSRRNVIGSSLAASAIFITALGFAYTNPGITGSIPVLGPVLLSTIGLCVGISLVAIWRNHCDKQMLNSDKVFRKHAT